MKRKLKLNWKKKIKKCKKIVNGKKELGSILTNGKEKI
jgi:hypothetical protein